MQPKLLAKKARLVPGADYLIHPGDFYIRDVAMYNSTKIMAQAIIIKCPFCNMDMMSTPIHKISHSFIDRLLSLLGRPKRLTVKPNLACPFNRTHSFYITKGAISAAE